MRCTVVGAAIVGRLLAGPEVFAGPPTPLGPLAFLIGEWEASGGAGQPGQAPRQAVFVSESLAAEPRYRLRYELTPHGVLKGEFAIAPPGEPPAFKPYLAWESRRAQAVKK